MKKDIEQKIVSLFPSACLREAIEKKEHHFSAMQLIAAAYQYAPDHDTRIGLLRELKNELGGSYARYCEKLISAEKARLEAFIKPGPGIVFELLIRERSDAYEEHYLCPTYEKALEFIPAFYKEYDSAETESVRYCIRKRRILCDGFSEDGLGEMYLNKGGVINSVYSDIGVALEPDGCTGSCLTCPDKCPACAEFHFPVFARLGDAVRIISPAWRGEYTYGIVGADSRLADDTDDYCYVLPFDTDTMRFRLYDNIFGCHEHIPLPLVDVIKPHELPEKYLDTYFAARAFLLSRE